MTNFALCFHARPWRIALAVGILLGGTTRCLAQPGNAAPPAGATATDAVFRGYTLQHVKAADVERHVRQLLDNGGGQADLIVDQAGNRLLVNGSPQAHEMIAKVIESIDRGLVGREAAPAQPAAPVLQSYPSPPGELQIRADAVRKTFPSSLGVRVAADEARGQVLVVAPPKLQAQIARFLQSGGRELPPAASPQAPATGPTLGHFERGSFSGGAIALQSRWDLMYGQLKGLFGERLRTHSTISPGGSVSISTIDLPTEGQKLRMDFDAAKNEVTVNGEEAASRRLMQLISSFDEAMLRGDRRLFAMGLGQAKPWTIREAVDAVQPVGFRPGDDEPRNLIARFFPQQPGEAAQEPPADPAVGEQPPMEDAPPADIDPSDLGASLVGPVEVEIVPELGIIVLRGRREDVEKVMDLINKIIEESKKSEPVVEVYPLKHANGQAIATIVDQLYSAYYSARSGTVSITPLVKPNSLLLIGQKPSVDAAKVLIEQLDVPADPASELRVFRLQHMSAAKAQDTILQFYAARVGPPATAQDQQQVPPGLFPRLFVIADFRSNAIIVRGSTRDLAEIAHLLSELDKPETAAELQIKIIKLTNSLATELSAVLQAAINAQGAGGQQPGGQQQGLPQIPGVQQQPGGQGQGQNAGLEQRSTALRLALQTLDAEQRRFLKSGVLVDVQISADARANALIVRAPESSMPLIEALVQQLDDIPGATAQIKVFTVVNGDAQAMVDMLNALFGETQQGGGGGGAFGGAQAQQPAQALQGESTLVPLRFAIDYRTNSIIATGSPKDLLIVEAILIRLDESDMRERTTRVYRLQNAPAFDVANAINSFLETESQLQQQVGVRSSLQALQEEVVVVPEIVTNTLIVSATARFLADVERIIFDLDRRPPMVMIQVLIAEVGLNNTDEFGVELGLQDSILFDRSLLGDLVTTQNSVQTNQGGAVITDTQQIIQGASLTPGFNFNNQPLGNSGSDLSRSTAGNVAGQALSSFSLGRVNSELGYGGLVLSASSESVSVLIRALQECRRLDVLSRPQIMTLDNQPAFVQLGQRVRLVQSSTFDQVSGITTNNLGNPENVGIILGVRPRINPDDGRVVMEIDVEKSEIGPEAEGIVISVTPTGEVTRSPRINTAVAQTTVSALSGQTVVLGGLITKSKATTHRRVPLLSSIPILGHLFRYDQVLEKRTELMIIMTPHIVQHPADAEWLKQVESARMSWVLSDVHDLHGYVGLRSRQQCCADDGVPTIYPDENPDGVIDLGPAENVPPGAGGMPADEAAPAPGGNLPPDQGQPSAANYFPGGRPANEGPALRWSAQDQQPPSGSSRSQSILRGEETSPQAFNRGQAWPPQGGPPPEEYSQPVGFWQGQPRSQPQGQMQPPAGQPLLPPRPNAPLAPLQQNPPYPAPPPAPGGGNAYGQNPYVNGQPQAFNRPQPNQPVTQAGGATVMYGNVGPGQSGRPLDVFKQQYQTAP